MRKPPIGSTVRVSNPVTGQPHEGVVTTHLSTQFVFQDSDTGYERIWCDDTPYEILERPDD